jgi:Tol biopolymer transport system component/DNA-binding winged helix-turn-helix (wHTH) protein
MRAVMSAETGQFYEFGDFRLDPGAKTLFCRDEPVALTPKAFDTLQFLVENAGRLLEKDELMQNLWQDRFVEEGNLAFHIKVLRRALQDDAQRPRFIETVPRRGYRFIAEVRQSLPSTPVNTPPPNAPNRQRKKFYWAISAGLILLAGALTLGTWRWQKHAVAGTRSAPILSVPSKSQKLSNTGSSHALITPDGKYVAYTNESGGRQSIWLRQLETSENIQVVPPSQSQYLGLAISHDGNSLYFARRDRAEESTSGIYRVMTFGGIPVKIADRSEGWIDVSPDDKQISFVRCPHQPDDNCSLFVIGNDGRDERRILTRPKPTKITGQKFSRDGHSIVFAAGQSFNGSRDFHLLRVNLASGAESEVSRSTFFVVNHLELLPGDDGFLFSAEETLDGKFRIWHLLANGETKALTNDSVDYNDISLSKAGDRLVATHLSNSFHLHLITAGETGEPRVLVAARNVTFGSNGRLVYSGDDGDIWSINTDGSEQRQLTNNAFRDFSPRVSPDGRYIFFASNRTGSNQIWRMNADGSDQIQITRQEGGYPRLITPDGKYVHFLSGLHQTAWRVAFDGGDETQLWNKIIYDPAFSPDGRLLAYCVPEGNNLTRIAVVSIEGHQTLHTFVLNGNYADTMKMVWANDGRNLIYVTGKNGRSSL